MIPKAIIILNHQFYDHIIKCKRKVMYFLNVSNDFSLLVIELYSLFLNINHHIA